tara:strand:- start:101 stop:280 length:180 start_codon:yes stop_codon:yes gene_type:complete
MAQKKTRKLLKKLLKNNNKRSLYTSSELLYMEKMYDMMVLQHQRQKKEKKGFQNEDSKV